MIYLENLMLILVSILPFCSVPTVEQDNQLGIKKTDLKKHLQLAILRVKHHVMKLLCIQQEDLA